MLKDKEAAKVMGIMGYRRVQENYTMGVYLPRLLSIYEGAIEARRKVIR
ncbi:MAG: hypothetical protein HY956_09185 [Deltaproteobacteria bacterium]|nr:hypothetical protein [Deltaproteobacteria bacterium]